MKHIVPDAFLRHSPPRNMSRPVVSPTPTTSARVHGRRDACLATVVAPLILPRLARASLVDETAAERAFASVSKSIVRVARVAQNGETTSVGSGFVWYVDDDDVWIATNAHGLTNVDSSASSRLAIMFAEEKLSATLDASCEYFANRSLDVAFVKIPKSKFPSSSSATFVSPKIGTSEDLRVGQSVFAVGFADASPTLTQGTISGLGRKIPSKNGVGLKGLIQMDAKVTELTSGGALCDGNGRIVGMNVVPYAGAGKRDPEGVNFAIPVNAVRFAADKM